MGHSVEEDFEADGECHFVVEKAEGSSRGEVVRFGTIPPIEGAGSGFRDHA